MMILAIKKAMTLGKTSFGFVVVVGEDEIAP
jgi:hypothetical protein